MNLYTILPGEHSYVYQGAILCAACGEATRAELASTGKAPAAPDDETTYDSDRFPKGPYPAEESGACDRMDACLGLARREAFPSAF